MTKKQKRVEEIIFIAQTYIFRKYPDRKTLFYVEDWQFKEAFGVFFKNEEEIH